MPLLKEALSATNCNPRDLKTREQSKDKEGGGRLDRRYDSGVGWTKES